MNRALFTAASGMHAQETRMNVTANNIANANTTGFKKGRVEFEALLSERIRSADAPTAQGGTRPAPLEVGLGVKTAASTRDLRQGDMLPTGNQTDMVIEGDGFFRVQRRDGSFAYTRAGNFRVDGVGRLVTQSGDVVQPGITIPEDATDMTVRGDGLITANVSGRDRPLELGYLEIALFQNPGGMHAEGENLFTATAASGIPLLVRAGEDGAGNITQGFLEGANVKPVEEMISLISTQRAYEMNSKVISAADEMMQRLSQLG